MKYKVTGTVRLKTMGTVLLSDEASDRRTVPLSSYLFSYSLLFIACELFQLQSRVVLILGLQLCVERKRIVFASP